MERKFRNNNEISRDEVGIPFDNCGERGLANYWAENGVLQPGRDRSKMTDIPKFEGRDREWRGYLNIPLESRRGIPFAFRGSRNRWSGGRFRRRRIGTTSIVIRPSSDNHPSSYDDTLNNRVCLYVSPSSSPFFSQIFSDIISESIILKRFFQQSLVLSSIYPIIVNNSLRSDSF